MKSRLIALSILQNVVQHKCSLSDVLARQLIKLESSSERAFVQALCFGVCRHYFRLDAIAKQLLKKSIRDKDQDVHLLILIGLYQLIDMRLPDYAAVSETVMVAEQIKKSWAKNLINAILRNYQRRSVELLNENKKNDVANYSHPAWMIKKIQQDWPMQWKAILEANNQHPPLMLRVNELKMTRENYLKKLVQFHITAHPVKETKSGIYLEKPMDVESIPGFLEGEVSVQDGAAQQAAFLLKIEAGQRILDACAAPGGKTSHILEVASNKINLIALDHDEARLMTIKENTDRLKLNVQCICADAGDVADWWDGKLFDRILLDAPCSATGVIRRHPDIKLLRKMADIAALARKQIRLLNSLWPLLKSGGLLVYATCSIFIEENEQVMDFFMKSHLEAKEEEIKADWGIPCHIGRQILPGMHGMDGFYYTGLRKYSL